MKQLFANNAKSTLSVAVSAVSTSFQVADPSLFPIPGPNEYFLATLEIGTSIEIVRVTSNNSGIFYLTDVSGRGVEGTTPQAFAAGARFECRTTAGTLNRSSTAFYSIPNVNTLAAPKDSYNIGYVCDTFDTFGNPVITIRKDDYAWRFLTYSFLFSSGITSGTTTSINTPTIQAQTLSLGNFLIQFTSGSLSGYVRVVSAMTPTSVSWTTPLPTAPTSSDTFEIVKSNGQILFDASSAADDSVIMALILGGA